ncbi:hypothetical protein BN381_10165 [Candidatus Microthrix parvicella RN1]|jgi:hypothetical protein|uniref:Uncharacterized protein n=1 Tax=Candidatus Neomicrothrix parvicella RN1 TaxID=1229780 RepID=R4YVI5_9ACTN|nr:hypothetical protein BN381_10165 [Candidatus Microthrix parvicella RN1]
MAERVERVVRPDAVVKSGALQPVGAHAGIVNRSAVLSTGSAPRYGVPAIVDSEWYAALVDAADEALDRCVLKVPRSEEGFIRCVVVHVLYT